MAKDKKHDEQAQQIADLTADLQRIRADFENYRKRVDVDKEVARASGKISTINTLLPVIDNIERSLSHLPKELEGNSWASGVVSLMKNLDKSLVSLNLVRINASKGTPFDHRLHEAVSVDDAAEGDQEVIAEELQTGYMLGDDVLRPAIVKVTRK